MMLEKTDSFTGAGEEELQEELEVKTHRKFLMLRN